MRFLARSPTKRLHSSGVPGSSFRLFVDACGVQTENKKITRKIIMTMTNRCPSLRYSKQHTAMFCSVFGFGDANIHQTHALRKKFFSNKRRQAAVAGQRGALQNVAASSLGHIFLGTEDFIPSPPQHTRNTWGVLRFQRWRRGR